MWGKEPGCLAGWVNISKSSELWLPPQWTGQRTGKIQWNEEQKKHMQLWACFSRCYLLVMIELDSDSFSYESLWLETQLNKREFL